MLERIRKAEEEGFTLIELLIVVIILGILAAIVVFAIGSTRKDSVSATCRTDVKSIQLAEEAWNTKKGSYTANQTDLTGTDGTLKSWPTGGGSTSDSLFITLHDATSVDVQGKNFGGVVNIPLNSTDATIASSCTPTA